MKKTPETGVVSGMHLATQRILLTKFVACPGRKVLPAGFTVYFLFLYSLLPAEILHNLRTSISEEPKVFNIPGNKSSMQMELVNPLMLVPGITVRFANPQFGCATDQYCVDVEFQSDLDSMILFGMNIRFFYDDVLMEIDSIKDFQGGYGPPSAPNPLTSGPGFGTNFFGFPSPGIADWVNTPIQIIDASQPSIYISTTGWTKLFQICFTIEGPVEDSTNFCPPIVWDLEANPANGGYLGGDDGVVITVVGEPPAESGPSNESVVQFNWTYTGNGSSPPYGAPIETDCIDISCLPPVVISCPPDIMLLCGDSSLPDSTGYATMTGGCDGPQSIVYSDSLSSAGCGVLPQIYRTWMASDTCGHGDTCIQILTLSDAGAIYGAIQNDLGDPIGGVEIMLMTDVNGNETIDIPDTLFATTMTDSLLGMYSFMQVPPCAYVIKEALPDNHAAMSDFDQTPDPDGDDEGDGPDLEIPVQLDPCEIDSNNHITNILCPYLFPILPSDTICENDSLVFEIEDLNIGLVSYSWNFGSGAEPAISTGIGPHTVQFAATTENQSTGASVTLTLSKTGCPDTTAQISLIHVNAYPDASINGSTSPGCYYTNRTFSPVQPPLPGAAYEWNFGYGAIPQSATGYGPHNVYYDTAGIKTVTLLVLPNEAGSQCPDSSSLTFQINNCPANIVGNVKSEDNQGISSVNLRLYEDVDTNGIADNANIIRSVFSTSNGNYSMAALIPGNYVIVQIQPTGWYSMDDGDNTADNDIVDNLDTLDNVIPVTLVPSELDAINSFIEGPVSGTITGSVFDDFDLDEFPDVNEGIANIPVELFADENQDGVADSDVPVETAITSSDGFYAFTSVPVGHYVLVEIQPDGLTSVKDYDSSNDADEVPNTNTFNDTIPVTIINAESDEHNYFIDAVTCAVLVTNPNDNGYGSFRGVIECVSANDTVFFHTSMAGTTITINSARLLMDKNLVIFSDHLPRITLASDIAGFFDITEGTTVEFIGVDIISGLPGNTGAAFKNEGSLILENINVLRNPLLPAGQFLIYNSPDSQLFLNGNCDLNMD